VAERGPGVSERLPRHGREAESEDVGANGGCEVVQQSSESGATPRQTRINSVELSVPITLKEKPIDI
jgi:hypothetical protein